ncbi:DEAD/DEAH box helicase [Parapedobacter indicus]|uniref:SWI/SNF-related matrix-associated actin-dependent regulator of chromatin subfamily A-like protein 1 n=1 Tax=Parapedobacter indicus TaxID=1477437 RepID=A0A1I3V0H2_9SPHI|nr:DEAD/DEAH box helicase [Parapedobacter indicus]PPK99020.1 SWI/SNF-related matrix-associated actin-dependent regulator 1 of chromatin subfamily A [Parapedobacter indicus]SFJ88449.1 SWI/SNF-related matrix-associated actin-dependent regulator of chromatin subfamily A-like protein 1 [Parapedobacter indicus]
MSIGSALHIGANFRIDFKYNPKVVQAIKELPERRFDFNEKVWFVPAKHRDEVVRFCKKFNLTFGVKHVEEPQFSMEIPPLPELDINIPLKRDLRPYQRPGVAYTISKQRLIMGDDMGLGKTMQAIASVEGLHVLGKPVYPCLVICPSAVKENWKREIEKTVHKKAIIMADSVKNTFPEFYRTGLAQFFIVNYESLKKYFVDHIDDPGKDKNGRKKPLRIYHIHFKEKYLNFFKAVIVDESHRVKALSTQATKFTKGVCTGKETILLLTGTPVINKPKDLISQLGILDRLPDFGGYKAFEERYCSGPNEASNLKELNYKLNVSCFYRRNKTDPEVKKYLPDKSRQVVLCDLNESARKEYNHAQADLESYMKQYKDASDDQIKKSMKGEVMVRIGILKNISARGKLKDAFDFIKDVIDGGQKIVVFCNLTDIVRAVQEKFPRSVRLTGAENATQKQASVDAFKNNPNVDLIVLNLKAGGVGVDGLQDVATQVCFIEFGWHAAIMDQAEDRLYRMGQHSNVMCTYFLGRATIDEWNYKLIQTKREIANTVTGNEDLTDVSIVDDLANLFNQK